MGFLVTGGAGFVGSALVDLLVERYPRAPITVLDALVYPMAERNISAAALAHPELRVVRGSVNDAELVASLLSEGDVVFHLAVEMGRPGKFIETQLGGTKTLLDVAVARKVGRFVYQSTSDIYGPNDADDITELAPVRPTQLYAATKLGAESLVIAYHHTHGLPVTVVRPVSIYGPRQYPGWLVGRFCNLAIEGAPLTIQGTGEARRDWIHVSDICHALVLASERPVSGEVFNLGTGREWSVLEIASMILRLAGRPADALTFLPAREGDFGRQITRAAKARAMLGWSARVPFEDGLAQTFRWYRDHRDWVRVQLGRDADKLGFRVKEDQGASP
jgi:dTDP-glucose 4,6-dehydratase